MRQNIILGFVVALVLASFGVGLFHIRATRSVRPAIAKELMEQESITQECTWSEVKVCEGGGHNQCCPKDK